MVLRSMSAQNKSGEQMIASPFITLNAYIQRRYDSRGHLDVLYEQGDLPRGLSLALVSFACICNPHLISKQS